MEAIRNPIEQAGYVGLAALSADLARSLAEENAENNLLFSPLSIYAAVALLAAGARGDTLDEILRVVGARSRGELEGIVGRATGDVLKDQFASGGPRIAFACGIWSDLKCPLKPAFREAVVGKYKADASSVDFIKNPEAARGQINGWVAQATNYLIRSIFGPGSITPLTRVVLGNALYFKEKWERPFDMKRSTKKLFYKLDGDTVDVPFMTSWSSQFIAVHDGFKVLKLRYQTAQSQGFAKVSYDCSKPRQFSMCIFLPDARDGLPSLLDMIASQHGFLHEHMPMSKNNVNEFRVPRFKLSFKSSVVTVLKKLGLQLPFSDQADMSDMVERNESGLSVVLSDVIHKVVIEVNEEGTKAAAVTMMGIRKTCAMRPRTPPPPVDFVADHPFAYFIVEEATGAIVFSGHILNPSREN